MPSAAEEYASVTRSEIRAREHMQTGCGQVGGSNRLSQLIQSWLPGSERWCWSMLMQINSSKSRTNVGMETLADSWVTH